MIPSALKSCIFVQAETILIDSLSTTRTRHSTPAALPGGVFFGGPLYLMTSFMISAEHAHVINRIQQAIYGGQKSDKIMTSFSNAQEHNIWLIAKKNQ